jgi:hypothetical protein
VNKNECVDHNSKRNMCRNYVLCEDNVQFVQQQLLWPLVVTGSVKDGEFLERPPIFQQDSAPWS